MRNILQTTTGKNFPIFSSSRFTRFAVPPYEPELAFGFDLDFYRTNRTTKVFDDAVTFARASSATYTDATGTIQTVSANVPRVGHHVWDGSQWVNQGLLLESEARTNLLTYSEAFDNAAWLKLQASITADADTGLDGTETADKLIVASGQSAGYIIQTAPLTSGVAYTYSIFAKADEFSVLTIIGQGGGFGSAQSAFFDLSAGTAAISTGTPAFAIEDWGNGWYRCSITSTATATTTNGFQVRINETGDGTSGIYIWGAQMEAGSTPSSYIKTEGSTATRAAETLTIPAANLPYSATAMSIAMQGTVTYADTDSTFLNSEFIRWGLGANLIQIPFGDFVGTGDVYFKQVATSVQDEVAQTSAYSPGLNVPFKIAMRNGSTFINGAVDGTALTADTTPTALPDLSTTDLQLGPIFMGTIKTFRMWADDLTDTGIEEASS